MEFFPIQRQSTRFQRAAFTNFVFEDGVNFRHMGHTKPQLLVDYNCKFASCLCDVFRLRCSNATHGIQGRFLSGKQQMVRN